MSQVLYDSLLEKWRDFLSSKQYIAFGLTPEIEIQNLYDDLVDEFCKEHNYSERTEELAFFGLWWDTFKDEFYQKLDKEGVKIIHEYPIENDWDYASSAGRKPQTGADFPPFRCDIQGPRQPLRSSALKGIDVSSSNTAPSAGGLPAHQMAKRDISSRPSVPDESHLLPRPSSPTLCPDDCPSKKFCDPSSCALESVRESNAMVEALRR